MIVFFHNKDLDGFASGAICKLKYPNATLIGWDYNEPIPDLSQCTGEDVIMIDITFPIEHIKELARISRLTIIDHHISFYNEFQKHFSGDAPFTYVYDVTKAACEIGWNYLFPNERKPYSITLLGRYDTWRQSEGDWNNETLPFQYAMRMECTSPETFPENLLNDVHNIEMELFDIDSRIDDGMIIIKFQEQQNMLACKRSSFTKTVYDGLSGICLNTRAFGADTVKTVYDPLIHDIMIGFEYTGNNWSVSLRSDKDNVDCSKIAKERGGGGHVKAAGFECKNFEDIFK